jgi:hypothetical protein
MKNFLRFITLSSAMLLLFSISSCKKEAGTSNDISYLSINNATLSALQFTIRAVPVSSGLARGASSGYLGVYEGAWDMKATLSDSAASTITRNVQFKGDEYKSLFVVRPDSLDFFVIDDDLTIRDPNRAKIKFLNLSPNASSLTLELSLLNVVKSFSDIKYKGFSPYQDFDEKSTYAITLKNHSANDAIILELEENFEKGKIYTIWTTGLLNSTVTAQRLTLHITEVK